MAKTESEGNQVDLNSASAEELMRVEGIDRTRAEQIIEYRNKRGGFKDWQELEEVPGIGPVLAQKMREAATLGGGGGQPIAQERGDGKAGAGPAEAEDVEVLSALAMLDLQAAKAYEAVAQSSDRAELAGKLREFAGDHFRHLDDLNRVLADRGEPTLSREAPGSDLLTAVTKLSIPLGPLAQVSALLVNEQLTNGTYDLALSYEWDDEVQALLDRNLADEQRHLKWLADQEDRLSRTEEEQPAPPPA
jgi:competence ComEA-like helix-hairpin-helix protein